MNKKKSSSLLRIAKVLSVLLMLGVFLFLFIFCTFLPRTTESDYDTLTPFPEFSFPALADGSYTAQLSAYFTDTIHNRDRMKDFYAKLVTWFGRETVIENEDGDVEIPIGDISIPDEEYEDESSAQSDVPIIDNSTGTESSVSTPADESSVSDTSTNPDGADTSGSTEPPPEIQADSILILGTRAMEIYYGDSNLKRIPRFADALNSFAEKNPNINVYSMVIPKQAAFYLSASKTYGNLAGRSLNDLNAIKEHLSDRVKTVNVYDALLPHTQEEIYFRTDHHWTALGAYYAAEQFASIAGLPFEGLDSYTKNVRSGYLGTMYKYSGYHQIVKDNPEDFVTYVPKATYKSTFYNQSFGDPYVRSSMFFDIADDKKSSWYSTFIGGDSYAVKLESDACSNGRKLLVVKDSYGNALAPYLLYSFEEVYIVDAREFQINLNTFVAEQGITDVLFAECAFSAVGSDYIDNLERLIG